MTNKIRRLRRTDGSTQADRFINRVLDHPRWPKIMAEDDAWFAYPLRKNVVVHLGNHGPCNIYCVAKNGETAEPMVFGRQKRKLIRALQRFPFDAILFGGCGKDPVNDALLDFIRDKEPGRSWRDCIDEDAFRVKLRRIRAAYLNLIRCRDAYSPDAVILAKGYEGARPKKMRADESGSHAARAWIIPLLERRNILNPVEQRAIVGWMTDAFNAMLNRLQAEHAGFLHVETPAKANVEGGCHGESAHISGPEASTAPKFMPCLSAAFA